MRDLVIGFALAIPLSIVGFWILLLAGNGLVCLIDSVKERWRGR